MPETSMPPRPLPLEAVYINPSFLSLVPLEFWLKQRGAHTCSARGCGFVSPRSVTAGEGESVGEGGLYTGMVMRDDAIVGSVFFLVLFF